MAFFLKRGGNNNPLEVQRWQYFLLRQNIPQVGRIDGQLRDTTWAAALDDLGTRLRSIIDEHGPESVGIFFGTGVGMDATGTRVAEALHAGERAPGPEALAGQAGQRALGRRAQAEPVERRRGRRHAQRPQAHLHAGVRERRHSPRGSVPGGPDRQCAGTLSRAIIAAWPPSSPLTPPPSAPGGSALPR